MNSKIASSESDLKPKANASRLFATASLPKAGAHDKTSIVKESCIFILLILITLVIKPGEKIVFYPSQQEVRIKTIEEFQVENKQEAVAGESTGITIGPEMNIRRGEVAAPPSDPPPVSDQFKAGIFWMSPNPCFQNRNQYRNRRNDVCQILR